MHGWCRPRSSKSLSRVLIMRLVGSIPMHFRHFLRRDSRRFDGCRTSHILLSDCARCVRFSAIPGVRPLRSNLRRECAAFCAAVAGRMGPGGVVCGSRITTEQSADYIPRSGRLTSSSGSDSHWANRSSTLFSIRVRCASRTFNRRPRAPIGGSLATGTDLDPSGAAGRARGSGHRRSAASNTRGRDRCSAVERGRAWSSPRGPRYEGVARSARPAAPIGSRSAYHGGRSTDRCSGPAVKRAVPRTLLRAGAS